jgi:hypothetical protein
MTRATFKYRPVWPSWIEQQAQIRIQNRNLSLQMSRLPFSDWGVGRGRKGM